MGPLDRVAWAGEHPPLDGGLVADPEAEPVAMVVPVDTGERIHYLDWGGQAGAPPVLLIHGLARTAWSWAPVSRRLCGSARLVALDLRGHGLSDVPRTGYELEWLAYDALTVLTAQGLGDAAGGPPVTVAGHGFGALVAATMARLRPAAVSGLALVDGGWEEAAEATRMSLPEFLAAVAEPPEVLASMEAFLADRRAFDPDTWDADQERAARSAVQERYAGHVSPVTRGAALRGLAEAMFSYRPVETLAAVACPMLVLVSEPDPAADEVRERRLALGDVERARAAPGGSPTRVVRFPGVAHDLMRHRPGGVAAELLALVAVGTAASGVPG